MRSITCRALSRATNRARSPCSTYPEAMLSKPQEIDRIELPLPLGTFINNRNTAQPNSTAFQLTLDEQERFLYVVSQRINQTDSNQARKAICCTSLAVADHGKLSLVGSRALAQDGVTFDSRPQGVVSVDL